MGPLNLSILTCALLLFKFLWFCCYVWHTSPFLLPQLQFLMYSVVLLLLLQILHVCCLVCVSHRKAELINVMTKNCVWLHSFPDHHHELSVATLLNLSSVHSCTKSQQSLNTSNTSTRFYKVKTSFLFNVVSADPPPHFGLVFVVSVFTVTQDVLHCPSISARCSAPTTSKNIWTRLVRSSHMSGLS